jgi:hypothetical protein
MEAVFASLSFHWGIKCCGLMNNSTTNIFKHHQMHGSLWTMHKLSSTHAFSRYLVVSTKYNPFYSLSSSKRSNLKIRKKLLQAYKIKSAMKTRKQWNIWYCRQQVPCNQNFSILDVYLDTQQMTENFKWACGIHHICKKGRICVKQCNNGKGRNLERSWHEVKPLLQCVNNGIFKCCFDLENWSSGLWGKQLEEESDRCMKVVPLHLYRIP